MASTIDEKNETNSASIKTFSNNLKNFLKAVVVSVLHVLIWFFIAGLVLYSCKLAQSNILPTSTNCYPYRNNKPNIGPITSDIFLTWFQDPQMSMKLTFPYNTYNSFIAIIDHLKSYKESSEAVFVLVYFVVVLEDMISSCYNWFNFMLNFMNQLLPEVIIILLGPILFLLVIIVAFIGVNLTFVYSWFVNMKWLFVKNVACPNEANARWQDVGSFSMRYFLGLLLVIIFCFSIFTLFPLSVTFSFVLIISCIISIASFKANYNNDKISFLSISKDIFKYYKFTIMAVLSYFIIKDAFANLGKTTGILCCVIVACIYLGWITIDMFKSIKETKLTPLVDDYEQATRDCVSDEPCSIGQASSGGSFLSFFTGGGNIARKLKKIGKGMKKN